MENNNFALEVKNITIQFGGLKANNDVCFDVKQGEIFGLIGPNGAGKTTLFNAVTGGLIPTSGDILFEGKSVVKRRPDQIARMGISRTYQNIRLFDKMTAEENVAIGFHSVPEYSRIAAMLGLPIVKRKDREVKEKTLQIMKMLNIEQYKDQTVGNLPYGIQRKFEIARALATSPKLLLLDEPAAGMNNDECTELIKLLKKIHKDFNLTIVLIEHHIDVVVNICEKICVLNLGSVLMCASPREVQTNPAVIEAYLGNRRNMANEQ